MNGVLERAMEFLSLKRSWRIEKESKEHRARVSLSNRGIQPQFEVWVEHQGLIDKKSSDLNEIRVDNEVHIDRSALR